MTVDDRSIFDVQIKRLHEYKRQLLNIFHIIHLYNELKENPNLDVTPHTFIFAAKAAPSYHLAKEVIKLIHTVASIVNQDRKSTRLNSSHVAISYAVFCLKKQT